MAENSGSGNNNNVLYFIVGGLVVIVAVFAILYFNGGIPGMGGDKTEITIEVPDVTIDTTE
ncbi:MAG: hypothetical protein WEC00_00795 [Dongiaceae bacterium]